MYLKASNIFIGMLFSLVSLVSFAWGTPVYALILPDLIDVVEIDGIDSPIIVEGNILPGDSFTRTLTMKNLTATPQDIAMTLDIDTSQGIIGLPDYRLERKLSVQVKRVSSGIFLDLPGGGTVKTLHDLDETVINLGSLSGLSEEQFILSVVFDINAGNEYQRTKVYLNLSLGIDVVGESTRLTLRKSNDSVDDEAPGNEVVYTLEVTAERGDVNDVTVTDLPPEGFAYVRGSGTGAPFIHEYASPGIWDVGDMEAGETRVLTYRTKISSTQDAGLYRDLAFAKGVSSSTIFANSEADPFVGTDVSVALDTTPTVVVEEDNENKKVEKTKKKTKYVLGASTLPMTGSNIVVIGLALIGLVTGLLLLFLSRRKTALPVLALLIAGGLSFSAVPGAQAASLSVKIETPEVVTPTPNFQIGFVTLDVLGRDLTVECYKNVDVVPFASYALVSAFGGNSGNCQVSGSVLPVDGDYEFYVKAIANGEEAETVESSHVNVKLSSTVPGTPYNYDRSDASCQNTITFTTADDGGKTVKVELYRSLATTFTADASTRVGEVAIGSNTVGSFAPAAPGCSNDSFYALRAVDVDGNGSGFAGDKDINVDTHTVTNTKTTTVTLPGATTGAVAVAGASTAGEGAVQGAETTAEESAFTPATLDGSVLGEAIEQSVETGWPATLQNHPWWLLLSFGAVLLLVSLIYRYYQRKKYDQSTE